MPNLSENLKKARERAGLTLKKLADLCQIQIKYLERLENGEFEKMPAPVYTRGFLKKCASVLNLNEEDFLADYQREYETARLLKQRDLKKLPVLRTPKVIITPKTLSLIAAGIIFLAVVGYLIYQLDFLIAPPKLSLEYPSADITISQSLIEIRGISDPSAKLTINGAQVYINNDGSFKLEVNLGPGQNTLNIEAVNRFMKKSEIIRQVMVK